MSVTKDSKTGKWMSQIRIKDWTGKEVHKRKEASLQKKKPYNGKKNLLNNQMVA